MMIWYLLKVLNCFFFRLLVIWLVSLGMMIFLFCFGIGGVIVGVGFGGF